jgi:rod shape-determining protein MreC
MRRNPRLIKIFLSIALFLLLEGISVILITNNSIIQKYRIMGFTRSAQSFFWKQGESVRYFLNYKKENQLLEAENRILKERIATLKKYLDDVSAEEAIARVSGTGDYTFIPATIIKNSINKQHNYIILNVGSKNGVEEGMGVITSWGIVGIVEAVSPRISYVSSFLNTSQSVSAKIVSNDVFGPMIWTGVANKAVVREIPIHTEVYLGDTISTSGYSAIFPPDIPLGIVTSVDEVNGVALELGVEMFQNFRALRLVDVVINNYGKEINTIENEME